MGENEAIAFVFFTLGTVVVALVAIVASNMRRHKIAKAKAETQAKLLEKFGSSTELFEYLRSDAGKDFLESTATERANPYGRVLGASQAGVILAILGLALLTLRLWIPDPGAQDGFMVIGTIALALGLGFLASAVISYRLSKSWGIYDRFSLRQK